MSSNLSESVPQELPVEIQNVGFDFKVTCYKERQKSPLMRELTMQAHDVFAREEDSNNFNSFKTWWENICEITESCSRWEFIVTHDRSPVIGVVAQVVPDIHYGKVVHAVWTYVVPKYRNPQSLRFVRKFLVDLSEMVGAQAFSRTSRLERGVFRLKYTEV